MDEPGRGPVPGADRIVRRRVLASGTVQGVFFRDACQEVATRHGVRGWVRNLPDLRVEAALEGPAIAVEAVVAWCHEGPPRGRVISVEIIDEEPLGETTFTVLW